MKLGVIADYLTVIAFAITIWQLIVVNKRLTKVETETKNKYKQVLNIVSITEMLGLIHSIQNDLTLPSGVLMTGDRIQTIIVKMQYLNDSLKDSLDFEAVNQYGHYNHNKLVSRISSDINLLREAFQEEPSSLDTRFMIENLQNLRDSIKSIETHIVQ